MAKRLLYRNAAVDHPLEAHRADSLAMWHASQGDGKEGVAAFLGKRDPEFTASAQDLPDLLSPRRSRHPDTRGARCINPLPGRSWEV